MRSQQLLALCGLVLASPLAIAAKLEHDDVPNRCWSACGSVVGISESCDAQHDNDSAELQCICNWAPAKTQIPLCAACITQYGDDDDDDHGHDHDDDDNDNDALDIVHSCSFSTTTYNAAAATTLSASATSTETAASAATTTNGAVSGSGSQGSSTTTSGGTASLPTATTDAAAGINAPGALYMAGLVGMLPLAWL